MVGGRWRETLDPFHSNIHTISGTRGGGLVLFIHFIGWIDLWYSGCLEFQVRTTRRSAVITHYFCTGSKHVVPQLCFVAVENEKGAMFGSA